MFPTPDPLWKRFPEQSPYSFAGNSPIWQIDENGEIKVTYDITYHENAPDKPLVNRTTSVGLMSSSYTSYYDGIRTYDWYDYTVYNTTFIKNDGTRVTTTRVERGKFRTNTLFNWEWHAVHKVNDMATKDENDNWDGWVLTTSEKLWPGNDNYLNAKGRGQFINVDALSSLFGVTSSASNVGGLPSTYGEALERFINTTSVINDAQGNAPIDLGLGRSVQCPSCGDIEDSSHIDGINGEGTYEKIKNKKQ